jgi:hypothetical protein
MKPRWLAAYSAASDYPGVGNCPFFKSKSRYVDVVK